MANTETMIGTTTQDLEFTTSRIPSSIAKTEVLYRPTLINPGTKTLAATVEDMRDAGCSVDRRTARYVLNFFFSHLVELFRKDGGCTRQLDGFGCMKPMIYGSLPGPGAARDSVANPVEITFIPTAEFRKALNDLTARNIGAAAPDSYIAEIINADGKEKTINGKGQVTISGRHINIVAGRADEGVFLLDSQKAAVATLAIDTAKDTEVVCHIEEAVAAGSHYVLSLRTRGTGDADAPLVMIDKPGITVI